MRWFPIKNLAVVKLARQHLSIMSLRNSAVSITKLGVIELAALGLLVMLSQACSCLTISPTLDTFSDPRNSSLQLMTVHHRTGDVFVGGTNVILHLSENLTFLDEVRHNPVEDNPSCPPTPLMCNYSRQLTDTQIKLLLIDYNQTDGQDMLISCGSTRQGLCEVRISSFSLFTFT